MAERNINLNLNGSDKLKSDIETINFNKESKENRLIKPYNYDCNKLLYIQANSTNIM